MTKQEKFVEVKDYFLKNEAEFTRLCEMYLETIQAWEDVWYPMDMLADSLRCCDFFDMYDRINHNNFNTTDLFYKDTIYGIISGDGSYIDDYLDVWSVADMVETIDEDDLRELDVYTYALLREYRDCE